MNLNMSRAGVLYGVGCDWGSVQGHPANRMTVTTENIDFPQLRLPAVTTQVRCVVLYLDSLGSPHDRSEHRRVTAALGRVRVECHEPRNALTVRSVHLQGRET